MANGFDNDTVFALNWDFRGATPVVGQVTAEGQLPIGSGGSPAIKVGKITSQTLSIGYTDPNITAEVAGGGVAWVEVTGTSQAALVSCGYVANNAGLVTITLPATFALGDVVRIAGLGTGLWRLAANTGNIINFGNSPTSAGGSLTATNRYDAVEVVGLAANTTWGVLSSVGNLTVA